MTAVSEQYSLLLQVLSPVPENPDLSLTIFYIGVYVYIYTRSFYVLPECVNFSSKYEQTCFPAVVVTVPVTDILVCLCSASVLCVCRLCGMIPAEEGERANT